MEVTIDAGLGHMLLAAGFALSCGLEALRRARGDTPPSGRFPVWLALLALVAGINWFAVGQHPTQLVKTWDVQHAVLGAKYGRELGYFRLYECMLAFDAEGPGRWAGLPEVSDLRETRRRLRPADAIAGSDCHQRFSPERRADFEADLAFFGGLPRQPNPITWFTDNGYNQTPFYTALLRLLLDAVPLSYGLLAGLVCLDVALAFGALGLVARTFGATTGLLLAIYFFTSFSNQFAMMGGSILRFGYIALLLLAASGFRTGRFAAAGAAIGIATLLQVFPAIFLAGLGLWAAGCWQRDRSVPGWLLPTVAGFGVTVAVGLLLSVGVAGVAAWPEFAEKIGIHNAQLAPGRVGLKLPFVLAWPPPPGGELDYAAALKTLAGRFPLYVATAGALLLGTLALVTRLSALAFALLLGCVVLYVLTPIHYYTATLALLFLVDSSERETTAAASFGRSLLFAISAGGFWLWRNSDGALALVNGYWLSPAIGFALVAFAVALWRARASDS